MLSATSTNAPDQKPLENLPIQKSTNSKKLSDDESMRGNSLLSSLSDQEMASPSSNQSPKSHTSIKEDDLQPGEHEESSNSSSTSISEDTKLKKKKKIDKGIDRDPFGRKRKKEMGSNNSSAKKMSASNNDTRKRNASSEAGADGDNTKQG